MGKREINTTAAPACAANGQSNVQLYGTADAMVYSNQLAGEKRVSCIDSGGLRAEFDLSSFFRLDSGLTASVFYAPSESTTAGRRLAFATCSSVLRG
jgi:hypothetical protein